MPTDRSPSQAPAPPDLSPPGQAGSGRNALLVGSGILSSRIVGLIRERIFAHYFGNSAAADAFKAALKIPNILQNLFGEGALSSSFIPVYARLLASGDRREAARVARVVGSLLALAMSLLVLVGMLATPLLIDLIAPGFAGEKREATIRMVRIVFPGIGLLVLSAWCLGILNSHRRFFLPYAAPVLWNLAMIGTLVGFGGREDTYRLAEYLAWGSVAGSLLQFGVQLPAVLRLAGEIHFQWDIASAQVRTVIRNFIPGMATRGVNQVSSAIDTILASFLPTGAVAALAYTQTLYLIPVSLFGMSISNAELPEMSSQLGERDTVAEGLRLRLDRALGRVAFFVVPSAAAFLALGDSIIGLLYQTGEFTVEDTRFVWAVLAGYTTGLLAATLGRLYTSVFWALGDTRTPLRCAAIRISTAAGLGWFLAFPVPAWLGLPARAGLVGLTAAAGLAAWVEFSLLRRALIRRIGRVRLALPHVVRLWGAALAAAAAAFALKLWLRELPPYISGSLVLAVFGSLYLAGAAALGMPDAVRIVRAVRKRMPFRAA
ncbi:MAG: murein biosynthesis integral membrane protein MurJ [Acidobacteria bacterium]|nr:murein biosynthesis integral membrane protein MurJ [Acidobacteriota bacterium]